MRLAVGRLHPHAGRAAVPDRQPLLRLEVRVRARAAHGRPPDLPRARQGARRLELDQRDDLPARQPARLRAWGGEPGMEALGLRALPAVLQAHGDLPGRAPTSGAAATGRSCSSAGRRRARCSTRCFAAAQQAGYPLTSDVNGYQQEGFARVRPQHPPRPPPERRARLPAPGDEAAQPRGAHARVRVADRLRGHAGGRRRGCGGGVDARRRAHPLRRRDQLAAAAAALGRRQRRRAVRARDRAWSHDLPGVGENLQDHLEVYVQHACTQPVSVQPALKWRNRPMVGAQWLFGRRGPGATNHFEAGGFIRSNDEVAYPNLMFHFLPLAVRYDGSAPAGEHGYQVHIGPMYSDARGTVKIVSRDPQGQSGAALQLPLDRPGPPRVGRGDPRAPARSSASRRGRPSTAASSRPARRSRATSRSSTGWRATPRPRCTRRARAAMGATSVGGRPGDACACTGSTACAWSTRR